MKLERINEKLNPKDNSQMSVSKHSANGGPLVIQGNKNKKFNLPTFSFQFNYDRTKNEIFGEFADILNSDVHTQRLNEESIISDQRNNLIGLESNIQLNKNTEVVNTSKDINEKLNYADGIKTLRLFN